MDDSENHFASEAPIDWDVQPDDARFSMRQFCGTYLWCTVEQWKRFKVCKAFVKHYSSKLSQAQVAALPDGAPRRRTQTALENDPLWTMKALRDFKRLNPNPPPTKIPSAVRRLWEKKYPGQRMPALVWKENEPLPISSGISGTRELWIFAGQPLRPVVIKRHAGRRLDELLEREGKVLLVT